MQGHDIIVLGTSAGGIKALTRVVRELPPDLPAAVFIVQHFPPDRKSILPEILSDVGQLPAVHARHGEVIRIGRIYIAPPDYHLLLNGGAMLVVRGPQENRFRPSIDALFRSAARTFGPRVIGVVLTGALDDGTIGLQAIESRGGITAVQDPLEAEYPSMPRTALRYAEPDYTLSLAQIPEFLERMAGEPAPGAESFPASRSLEIETRIAEQDLQGKELVDGMDAIGMRSPYTCPACNGTLWEIGPGDPIRFRCHTGHAFSKESLLGSQNEQLEQVLWSSVRLMEEKANSYRQLAKRGEQYGRYSGAQEFERSAAALDEGALIVKRILFRGTATRSIEVEEDEEASRTPGEHLTPETVAYR